MTLGNDAYLEWLLSIIKANEHPEYTNLLNILYQTFYTYTNTNLTFDYIRVRKALELRSIGPYGGPIGYPLTCLELLISIAIDTEQLLMRNSDYGDRTAFWFWTMVGNLNLLQYTDTNFHTEQIHEILDNFIFRKYDKNGYGSIGFTVNSDSKTDFKTMDLWRQFCIYLHENYSKEV